MSKVPNYIVFLIFSFISISCTKSTVEDFPEDLSVSNDLYSEVGVQWSANHNIDAEGKKILRLGYYASDWLYGAGVYKIEKGSRNSSYSISFSLDGEEGTRVISFRECKNSYFVVTDALPYFRLSTESPRITIKKVKPFQDARVDIREFGAIGDGKHDNTKSIQEAIDYVAYGQGGTVYIPNGTFLLNTVQEFDNMRANLIIPYNRNLTPYLAEYNPKKVYYVNSRVLHEGESFFCIQNETTGEWDISKWKSFDKQYEKTRINIEGNGRTIPYRSFIDRYSSLVSSLDQGSFLVSSSTCDYNDGTKSTVSVLACGFDKSANFQLNSNSVVNLKGFTLKTDDENGYSRLSGIDMSHCQCLFIDDVSVYSAERIQDTYSEQNSYLHESNHFSCGVMMPATFCDPTTYAHNVTVSGAFTIGFLIGDCQSLEDCWVGLCRYGFVQCEAGHPSVVGGHIFSFNTNNAIASVASLLSDIRNNGVNGDDELFGWYSPKMGYLFVNQISVEPATGLNPQAYNMENVVYDPSNTLRGSISYINADDPSVDLGIVGGHNIRIINLGKL